MLNHTLDLSEGTDDLVTQIINGSRCVKMITFLETIEEAPRGGGGPFSRYRAHIISVFTQERKANKMSFTP